MYVRNKLHTFCKYCKYCKYYKIFWNNNVKQKGLPVALKIAKRRQVLSSEFMWKNNSPVMLPET